MTGAAAFIALALTVTPAQDRRRPRLIMMARAS